ncbi:MAG: Sec-independent protein translocase protein TatB [Rhizobiaceae bacterium]|nr:Sec-independent protein translocase protein TatB [Rhizobiaceae bacterium]
MFDIGWTEMLVIAVVMIVVVGPKDLPKMLRTFGRTTSKLRAMAGDFQKQFNEALKEAELDDVKKSVDSLRGLNPTNEIKKHLNPFEKAAADVRAGLDSALKPAPKPSVAPSTAVPQPAEPLKNCATAMPGVAGPERMPEPPVVAPTLAAAVAPQAPVAAVAAAAPQKAPRAARAASGKAASAAPREPAAKPAAKSPTAKSPAAKPAKSRAKSTEKQP